MEDGRAESAKREEWSKERRRAERFEVRWVLDEIAAQRGEGVVDCKVAYG